MPMILGVYFVTSFLLDNAEADLLIDLVTSWFEETGLNGLALMLGLLVDV